MKTHIHQRQDKEHYHQHLNNMKKLIAICIITSILTTIIMSQLKYPLDKRSQEIIKRTIENVLEDKIFNDTWKKTFHFMTFFESLDGYNTDGTVNIGDTQLEILTGALDTNTAGLIKQPTNQGMVTFSQKSYFRTGFLLDSTDAHETYMIIGSLAAGSYYGFKIDDTTLKGVSYDGTTESEVTLATIASGTIYGAIEARYFPNDKIVFFLNAKEVGVKSNNLPSPATVVNTNLFTYKITTNEDVAKQINITMFEYLQSRNVLK